MNKADLHAFLERLRSAHPPLSVEQKRRHLANIAQAFKTNRMDGADKDWITIAEILVEDSDWHVRQDLAEMLLFVPEPIFCSLMPKLQDDVNAYVRHTAERTIVRRQRASRDAKRAMRGMALVEEKVARFAKEHGEDVAREALQLPASRQEAINAEITHDLLNLLASLKEDFRYVRTWVPSNEEAGQDAIKGAFDTFELFERALNDFREYSIDLEPESRPEALPFVVRKAKRQALGALKDRGVDTKGIVIDQQGVHDVDVRMSLGLVVQAMANAIINAVEAHATVVKIKATRRPGWIDIAITDNGAGLSPQKLAIARQFVPGRKNHKKTRSTGYGLCNIKKNIEAHGGQVKLESVHKEGMTVTLSLPL